LSWIGYKRTLTMAGKSTGWPGVVIQLACLWLYATAGIAGTLLTSPDVLLFTNIYLWLDMCNRQMKTASLGKRAGQMSADTQKGTTYERCSIPSRRSHVINGILMLYLREAPWLQIFGHPIPERPTQESGKLYIVISKHDQQDVPDDVIAVTRCSIDSQSAVNYWNYRVC
jgi:hypothetical protein